ncbi:MAG: hypothetical protein R3F60_09810 [bacterium]
MHRTPLVIAPSLLGLSLLGLSLLVGCGSRPPAVTAAPPPSRWRWSR